MREYRERKAIKVSMVLDLHNGEQTYLTDNNDSVSDGQRKGGIDNVSSNDYFKNRKNSTIYTPKKGNYVGDSLAFPVFSNTPSEQLPPSTAQLSS